MLTNQTTVVIPPGIQNELILKFVEDFHQMSLEPSFMLWEMFHHFLLSSGFVDAANRMQLSTDFQAVVTLVHQIKTVKSCKS